ncbi:MAG: Hsp20/alpha crystallin family protein [Pseudobdellovibrio sp.]
MRNLILTPNRFDRLFNQLEDNWMGSTWAFPKVYSEDSEKEDMFQNSFSSELKFDSEKSVWLLTAEIPGVKKDNLKLDVKEDYLHISGEKTIGLNTGTFEQVFKLPKDSDYEKIEAEFADGVLALRIPLQEKKTIKSIQLK